MSQSILPATAFAAALVLSTSPAQAKDIYRDSNWPAMSADRRASEPGDLLTVVIFQSAQSTNVTQNRSRKATDLAGSVSGGTFSKEGSLSFGGGFAGRGEITRSEKLIGQITLSVLAVLPNGDLVVGGEQFLNVNGERTRIGVRGRIRTADIRSDNSIDSNRIADAQIDYDGRGFVSRSAKPGIINRIFSFLGLG